MPFYNQSHIGATWFCSLRRVEYNISGLQIVDVVHVVADINKLCSLNVLISLSTKITVLPKTRNPRKECDGNKLEHMKVTVKQKF